MTRLIDYFRLKYVAYKLFLAMMLILPAVAVGCADADDSCVGELSFDAAVESAIRSATGISDRPLTATDVNAVLELNVSDEVDSLDGLQCLTNLESLTIVPDSSVVYPTFNYFNDITPLAGLTHLKKLALDSDELENIAPLSQLDTLEELSVQLDKHVIGLTAIGKLGHLKTLSLWNADNSVNLTAIVGAKSLTTLELRATNLNVTPLASLPNLTSLDLHGNISLNVASLQFLQQVKNLNLSGCGIANLPGLAEIAKLSNLTSLNLSNNEIQQIGDIARMTWLTDLNLSGNKMADISSLQSLTALNGLDLSGNTITDISPLRFLSSLNTLNLSGNAIGDITATSQLTQLTTLNLDNNNITSLAPLVENPGIDSGDQLSILDNAFNCNDFQTLFDTTMVEAKGVTVITSCDCSRYFCNGGTCAILGTELTCNSCSAGRSGANCNQLQSCSGNIVFPDSVVENAVRTALNLPTGAITAAQLATLSSLQITREEITEWQDLRGMSYDEVIGYRNIEDLAGLHCATGLQSLAISGIGSADLAPLANLPQLSRLSIWADGQYTPVDLGGLSGITSLETLELSGTPSFESAVLNTLPNLKALTALAVLDHFTAPPSLTTVSIGHNTLSLLDLLPDTVAFTVDLSNNDLTDVSFLLPYTNIRKLDVSSNPIADMSVIANLTLLESLSARNTGLTSLAPFATLNQLTILDVSYNQITDISPLSGLQNLTSLKIAGNEVTSLEPLQQLLQLTELDCSDNPLVNLNSISALTNLTSLSLAGIGTTHDGTALTLSSIQFIQPLTALQKLNLSYNIISDITPLADLTNLTSLNLAVNGVADISTLARFSRLTELNLQSNQITDISPLGTGTFLNLVLFVVQGNPINDFSPLLLMGLPQGTDVYMDEPYSDFCRDTETAPLCEQLESAGIAISYAGYMSLQ